jgi:hypothetical protein
MPKAFAVVAVAFDHLPPASGMRFPSPK